jgi:hypothetical protein
MGSAGRGGFDRLLGRGGSGGGLGGWALGAQARELPDGLAYHLPRGSDLILSTHFHPSGKVEHEASTVALYFADRPPAQKFMGLQLPVAFGVLAGINIPPGKKDFAIADSFVLPVDVKAFAVSAHAHYIAKQFQVTATQPGGKPKTLLSIPDWDFAWQEQYQFRDFVALPKGTKIDVKITYDNSADNRVRWGRESTDEMGSISLQVVAAREPEFSRLQEGYRQHVMASLSKSPLRKLLDRK